MGRRLQVASDKPDLVPATGDPRVLVHGHHVVVSPQLVADAQNLPKQSDLTAHRDLGGGPEKWPDSQSDGRVSDTQPIRKHRTNLITNVITHLVTTLIGSLWTMVMSGSQGCGGLAWNSAGRKNEVSTSFSNVFPSSIMWMVLITGTVIPRYLPAHGQHGPISHS